MTKDCIKEVQKLAIESDIFSDLTVEQLLYAAIAGSDFDEVKSVLELTNWSKFFPHLEGNMIKIFFQDFTH